MCELIVNQERNFVLEIGFSQELLKNLDLFNHFLTLLTSILGGSLQLRYATTHKFVFCVILPAEKYASVSLFFKLIVAEFGSSFRTEECGSEHQKLVLLRSKQLYTRLYFI